MLYHQVGATGQVYRFSKSIFDLLFNSEMFKYGLFMPVQFHNLFHFRRDLMNIRANVLKQAVVAHINIREVGTQNIADQCGRTVHFTPNAFGRLGLRQLLDKAFPFGYRVQQIFLKFGNTFSF
ncbi:hypothetical protein D3C86_1717490 [compost metagenome]